MMLRMATALVSPAGTRGRLSSFIFHRVFAEPDPLLPDIPCAAQFDEMLDWIGGQFQILAPRDACECLAAGRLPARAAIISFDDGYRDNVEVAAPILRARGLSGVFFIATGYLDGGIMFNDRVIEAVRVASEVSAQLGRFGLGVLPLAGPESRRQAIDAILQAIKHLPFSERLDAVAHIEDVLSAGTTSSPMMSSAQVAELQRLGMVIGGHTRTHPILAVLDDASAKVEIEAGRDDLKALTGEAPDMFAYPNGKKGRDYLDTHVGQVAAAGFQYAFTTDPGTADAASARFELPRFTPWDRRKAAFQARALANLFSPRLVA